MVLVGNKSDLPASEKRDATVAAAVTFAQQNQLTHLEASARSVRRMRVHRVECDLPICFWEVWLELSAAASLTFELFSYITGPECGGNLYSACESNAAARGNYTAECGECQEKNTAGFRKLVVT